MDVFDLDNWRGEGFGGRIFPLQTQQSMAERWNTSRQNVARMAKVHKNFPQELKGIIADTKGAPKLYPLYDVIRYERERGLKNGVNV